MRIHLGPVGWRWFIMNGLVGYLNAWIAVQNSNIGGAAFTHVETVCRGIPCPLYDRNKEITCVVCTKWGHSLLGISNFAHQCTSTIRDSTFAVGARKWDIGDIYMLYRQVRIIKIPTWAFTLILLVQPFSAAAERVFSLLQNYLF